MTGPYYEQVGIRLWSGDCIDVMRGMEGESFDAVVCDPPYNLSFMGRSWDSHDGPLAFQQWCTAWAVEAHRLLKPGGHLLAFGGTRTYHRLASGIEDAGFEIRDSITWMYASGFPKSHDVSRAIDVAAGVERPVVGAGNAVPSSLQRVSRVAQGYRDKLTNVTPESFPITAAGSPEAAAWSGWGTALKPASEPVVVARKPLEGTVATNVLRHGTGALNIDGCRIESTDSTRRSNTAPRFTGASYANGDVYAPEPWTSGSDAGRWPSNVVLSHAGYVDDDGAEVDLCADGCVPGCPVADLNEQSGVRISGDAPRRRGSDKFRNAYGNFAGQEECPPGREANAGGASRFYPSFRFEAKAPTSERPVVGGEAHPTVKPLALMRWIARLVVQPGGGVLDPFGGSGTTGEACLLEGFDCDLIEKHEPYLPLIVNRLSPYRDQVALARARARGIKPVRGVKAQVVEESGSLFDFLDSEAVL